MFSSFIVVDGYIAPHGDDLDLRREVWGLALDQRMFGPRKLVVAFAEPSGRLCSIAHTDRTDPPEPALDPCIRHVGAGAVAAVAFCDEPVVDTRLDEIERRFLLARSFTEPLGVHLVDWISCDDLLFRSARLALQPSEAWWSLP
jgi:hypothetical protein